MLPMALAAALAASLLAASEPPAPQPVEVSGDRRTYRVADVTTQDPILAELFAMANDVGFSLGTWGGTSRDFLLGKGPPPKFSDSDMVFDSRELWAALKSDGFFGFFKKIGRIGQGYWRVVRLGGVKAIRRYSMLDRNPGTLSMSIPRMIESGDVTVNQVGLMADGTIFDPNGGLDDILSNRLRYALAKPVDQAVAEFSHLHDPSPYDVLRAIRFKSQYPELAWDPASIDTLKRIMTHFEPGDPATLEIADYFKGPMAKVRNKLPHDWRHIWSNAKVRVRGAKFKDLGSYIEKGMDKILASTKDPADSLAMIREVGLDDFLVAVGLESKLRALETAAATGQAGASADLTGDTGDGPAEPPRGEAGTGTGGRTHEGGAAPAGAREAVRNRLQGIADSAYQSFLAAEKGGDQATSRQAYEAYLRARSLLEATR